VNKINVILFVLLISPPPPPNPLPYSYFYESTSTTPENSVQRVENRIEIKKQAKNKEKL
jgi:hypothetical protein